MRATGAVFGIGLERCLRVSFSALRCPAAAKLWSEASESNPRLVRWLPAVLCGVMAVFFAVYFSTYTLLHHYRLQTQSLDLAVYDNEFWNLLRGKWFKISPGLGRTGSHMAYYAEFAAYLLAPFSDVTRHMPHRRFGASCRRAWAYPLGDDGGLRIGHGDMAHVDLARCLISPQASLKLVVTLS